MRVRSRRGTSAVAEIYKRLYSRSRPVERLNLTSLVESNRNRVNKIRPCDKYVAQDSCINLDGLRWIVDPPVLIQVDGVGKSRRIDNANSRHLIQSCCPAFDRVETGAFEEVLESAGRILSLEGIRRAPEQGYGRSEKDRRNNEHDQQLCHRDAVLRMSN